MSILEKQQVVWRSRYNKSPLLGNKLINYYEDVFFAFLFWFFIAFVVSAIVLWQINLKQFPIPPAPGFQGEWTVFHHLLALAQVFLNKIPYWHPFQTDAIAYLNMTGWLANNGILHILTWRINAALFLGFVVGVWQAVNKTEKPVPFEQTANKRGMEIILPDLAPQEFSKETFEEVKKSGKFCELAQDTFLTFSRFRTHHIGFGASGTGKSQFLNSLIRRAIELGLKLVILDPKYEFTQAYYDPNNPAHAILDPTDSRSHVWDFKKDLNTLSIQRRFANSYIPPGEGDAVMWSNAARLQFVGYSQYLDANFDDYTPKDIADLMRFATTEQSLYIYRNYFPDALDTLGQIEEEQTKPEQNVTSFGVRLNLKGYIDGLLDLARYWHDENQKKISLRDFMVNPDSEIRVLFIKPNDSERLMSSGIIRSALNYMISLLDTPAITDSSEVRGAFILDEFQAPGKLATEDGKPTVDKLLDRGRSKGFAACIFAQDATQLYGEYSENDVKKWRQVASGFVLTGTAPGDTAEMVSNMIGKRFFDKLHRTFGYTEQGKPRIGDASVQQHDEQAILPTELSAYLTPKDGHIHYIYLARGLKNAYIFKKAIEPIPQIEPAWMPQEEKPGFNIKESRVMAFLKEEIESKTKAKKAETSKDAKAIGEILDDMPEGEDFVELEDLHGEEVRFPAYNPLPIDSDLLAQYESAFGKVFTQDQAQEVSTYLVALVGNLESTFTYKDVGSIYARIRDHNINVEKSLVDRLKIMAKRDNEYIALLRAMNISLP